MARKSPRLTPQQWQALVQEYAHSGMPRESFCRSRNINKHTFSYWQQKLKQNAAPASARPASHFIEVKQPPSNVPRMDAWDVELTLGQGITLRLRVS